ncbi:hypothetical protein KJS94_10815 [Flavihumibacter rivuli]|uniref:c-type cytochrome domain-containing protein n=1 Tax=Flavihumibacter rivuli TaxID=2838156 RepID=UPI001BDEC551|nr:c-type cytochrome domain-containing protein [Flavihumibacter rivuli]ULQ55131.1 hypothetical protein KJS94_10815 [Flavihumibacter rivuli]
MRKQILALSGLCCLLLVLSQCKHEAPQGPDTGGNEPPPSSSTCSADTVYFSNTILPLIVSNCAMSGCHDAASAKEGIVLTSYQGIMKIVKAGNARDSKLVEVIKDTGGDRMPPAPNAPLSSAQIASIEKWINQGAKNNSCTGTCDTSGVISYSTRVQPILNNKCTGCHNNNLASAGINLTNYTGVRTVALNGKLYGSIAHLAGYSPMPQGSKLPDCEIATIKKWIDNGSPNN